jgi:NAD(P)-dependent dehydrogenase (short-subunit alcohol dehydrogenase family)
VEDLQSKLAIITGGASGTGLAKGEAFAEAGMKIVLADIEAPALDRAMSSLRDRGAHTG